MFAWLRNKVREAILAGVHDALEHLDSQSNGDLALAAAELDARIRALPAPAEEEPVTRQRKGGGK